MKRTHVTLISVVLAVAVTVAIVASIWPVLLGEAIRELERVENCSNQNWLDPSCDVYSPCHGYERPCYPPLWDSPMLQILAILVPLALAFGLVGLVLRAFGYAPPPPPPG